MCWRGYDSLSFAVCFCTPKNRDIGEPHVTARSMRVFLMIAEDAQNALQREWGDFPFAN